MVFPDERVAVVVLTCNKAKDRPFALYRQREQSSVLSTKARATVLGNPENRRVAASLLNPRQHPSLFLHPIAGETIV